ncbi:hypothetical protein HOD30_02175 [Candidatus Peregrinibacteria bacterium]|jgi:hypothetical protein|nr:hypothetical protein [Candidatus Peregrinibacteria bacterium]MBT4631580.1 hypothetical protein [Candidatus Peregrinibacteria bacterium]MBT5517202.1 hypothetical protein [Candidatus Peregrinibacteria bacterium]MBT5824123.1 hypothetical protein [Candidatus Peregrinibacteria bacterium]
MSALSYKGKKQLVDMLVEKVEISEVNDKQIARMFFRFDQKVVREHIPNGRFDLQVESKKTIGSR